MGCNHGDIEDMVMTWGGKTREREGDGWVVRVCGRRSSPVKSTLEGTRAQHRYGCGPIFLQSFCKYPTGMGWVVWVWEAWGSYADLDMLPLWISE